MAANKSDSAGTAEAGNAPSVQQTKPLSVAPVDGWDVQSPYGALKTCAGVLLVRLEDVHLWVMQRDDIPSASAAARVFGVFVSDASSELGMKHGAAKLRSNLYITDLSDYADSLGGWTGRSYLEMVAEQVPYVFHHRLDKGTPEALFYALGLLAGEVWAPQSRSVGFDDRMEGYSADGYFPAFEKSREILGHFAVPIGLAHEIWGWGTVLKVGNVAPLHAVPEADGKPVISEKAVEWTVDRLWATCQQFERDGKGKHMKRLAEVSGMKDREIRRMIAPYRKPTAMASMASSLASKSTGRNRKQRG